MGHGRKVSHILFARNDGDEHEGACEFCRGELTESLWCEANNEAYRKF